MTEFAIVVPVLLLVVFAILQLGIVFHHYVTLTDATRAGVRQGAVSRHLASGREDAVEDRVRGSAVNLDQDKLDVTVSSGWEQGADVTVTATYPYDINLLGFVVASGDLTSTATERVE
jgi:Flp pilus assembly protein TadG